MGEGALRMTRVSRPFRGPLAAGHRHRRARWRVVAPLEERPSFGAGRQRQSMREALERTDEFEGDAVEPIDTLSILGGDRFEIDRAARLTGMRRGTNSRGTM